MDFFDECQFNCEHIFNNLHKATTAANSIIYLQLFQKYFLKIIT